MSNRQKTQYPGVRYREHPTRKHGIMPDRYFFIRYKLGDKDIEEGIGWASEDNSAKGAFKLLCELKENQKAGSGPLTLREKRELQLQEREKEAAERRRLERENITYKEFFENSYLPLARRNKKSATCDKEDSHFRIWLDPILGRIPIRSIVPLHLEKVKSAMVKAGKAPRTIQYVFATFRQSWNLARRDGLVMAESPSKQVKIPKFDNRRQRYLSVDECDRILQALQKADRQMHDIALLALHCGLRAGEILSLEWPDVDLDRGILTLRDTKSGQTGTAYLTAETKAMLASLPGKRSGFVFKGRDGGKVNNYDVSGVFSRTADSIGLNKGVTDRRYRATFHVLRHTYASRLIEHGGADLFTVQKALRQKTAAMAERYSHLTPGVLRNAVKNMEESVRATQKDKPAGQEESGVTG